MKLGVAGKGGVGKTTISAVLARSLARRGHRVVAVDCDSDPNLAANTGLTEVEAAGVRTLLDQSSAVRSVPVGVGPRGLLAEYGRSGPDDITLLTAARAERAGSG